MFRHKYVYVHIIYCCKVKNYEFLKFEIVEKRRLILSGGGGGGEDLRNVLRKMESTLNLNVDNLTTQHTSVVLSVTKYLKIKAMININYTFFF